jgi:hypothetical protein
MDRHEAEVFRSLAAEAENPSETALGDALRRDAAGPNALTKIWRRQQAAIREWTHARAELRRIQGERAVLTARRERAAMRANEANLVPTTAAPHPNPTADRVSTPNPKSAAPASPGPNEPNFASKTGAASAASRDAKAVALYHLLRSENLL